jgi:4'-phosphopantetheinyl transferase EntD
VQRERHDDLFARGAAPSLPLRDLFGCDVEVAQAAPALVDDALYAAEREIVANAVAKRRAEFGVGRLCARRALAALGVAEGPILANRDRAPVWPDGVVGSITHTHGYCAAVVARASAARSLGLDAERDVALKASLEEDVCTPSERAWLDRQPRSERGRLGILFFSAKEAFYKCQHPITGTFLSFADVDIALRLESATFEVTGVRKTGSEWSSVRGVRGRFVRGEGLVVTAATL